MKSLEAPFLKVILSRPSFKCSPLVFFCRFLCAVASASPTHLLDGGFTPFHTTYFPTRMSYMNCSACLGWHTAHGHMHTAYFALIWLDLYNFKGASVDLETTKDELYLPMANIHQIPERHSRYSLWHLGATKLSKGKLDIQKRMTYNRN